MKITRSAVPYAITALCASTLLVGCSGDDPEAIETTPAASSSATSTAPPTTEATTAPPTQSASTTPTTPRCTTPDLTGELIEVEPGAGQRFAQLLLTNATDQACTIFGYGGAQLYGSDGGDLPTNLVRDQSVRSGVVTLEPGESAQSQLHWSIVAGEGDGTGDQCQPDPATLAVIPPDETTALDIAWTLGPVCEKGRIDQQPYLDAN